MNGDCRDLSPFRAYLPESTLTKKGGATLDPKKAKTAVGAAAAFKKREFVISQERIYRKPNRVTSEKVIFRDRFFVA